MNAIILAAGMGTRLKDLTTDKPKALVKIADKTLIEYVIDLAMFADCEKTIVVTGSGHDLVRSFVERKYGIDNIVIVENKNYKKGNLYSLQAALPFVSQGFFLFNVDHVFSKQFIQEALNLSRLTEIFTIFCDNQKKIVPDQMKVLEEKGRLQIISKKITNYNTGYTGLDYCPDQARENFLSAVHEASRNFGGGAVKEDAINCLVQAKRTVHVADVSGFDWFEVDTQEDLALAEKLICQTQSCWI